MKQNRLMTTGLAALLATFFVLSSFGAADARHRYRHRGAAIGGFVAGVIVGGAIASKSRARQAKRHWGRHCHRKRSGRIYKCHNHKHSRRHHR